MKIISKSALLIILTVFFTCGITFAQQENQSDQQNGTKMKKAVLTEDQKALLKTDMEKRKELRESFKSTLSQEQKDMLTDPRMVKSDRIKAFRASLTDQQVTMIKARQQEIKAERTQFRATLSDQQKMQFRRMAMYRARMNKALFTRARLRHRLMGI